MEFEFKLDFVESSVIIHFTSGSILWQRRERIPLVVDEKVKRGCLPRFNGRRYSSALILLSSETRRLKSIKQIGWSERRVRAKKLELSRAFFSPRGKLIRTNLRIDSLSVLLVR